MPGTSAPRGKSCPLRRERFQDFPRIRRTGNVLALECVRKSMKRFSGKTHDKNKELERAFHSIKSGYALNTAFRRQVRLSGCNKCGANLPPAVLVLTGQTEFS